MDFSARSSFNVLPKYTDLSSKIEDSRGLKLSKKKVKVQQGAQKSLDQTKLSYGGNFPHKAGSTVEKRKKIVTGVKSDKI